MISRLPKQRFVALANKKLRPSWCSLSKEQGTRSVKDTLLSTRQFHSSGNDENLLIFDGLSFMMRKHHLLELKKEASDLIAHVPSSYEAAPAGWKQMSWKDYLFERGWLNKDDFFASSPEAQRAAIVYLSSYLSYQLTVAHEWEALTASRNHDEVPKICIVGAEMEFYLILPHWDELFVLIDESVDLEFLGPAMDEDELLRPSYETRFETVKTTTGTLEDNGLPDADAFLVFHPGAGTNKKYTWEKAFKILRSSGRPLLLTAHDEEDAARDAQWWAQRFPDQPLHYKSNPWKTAHDPLSSPLNGYRCVLPAIDR